MENLQDILSQFKNSEVANADGKELSYMSKRQKIYVFQMVLVEEFNSIDECEKKYGEKMLNSYRNGIPCDGLYFTNMKDGSKGKRKTTKGSKIRVLLNGLEVGVFDSVTEASSKLDIHRTCIQHTLSGKYKHYKGYTFEYKK
jgi:hypothetical protein